jgi:uncharacterized protein YcfJ
MKKSILIATALLASSILSAESVSTTQYLKVIKSTPIYGEAQPCVDGVATAAGAVGGVSKDTISTLAGGAIGGLLGTQVGSGRGKTVATIGGALLGAMAGKTAAGNYTNGSQGVKCQNNGNAQGNQTISGYTNTAHLNGKEIQVQSDQPLTQIPVTVTYSY